MANLDKIKKDIEKLEFILNGGKGSGNFGHAGRIGKLGGSAPKTVGAEISAPKKAEKPKKELKVTYMGEKSSQAEINQQLQDEHIENTIEELEKCRDFDKLTEKVMGENGWKRADDGGMMINGILDNPSYFKEQKKVMNNGKEYLEKGNYTSQMSDEDGYALYTTDNKQMAMVYADQNENKIAHLVLDTSNYIGSKTLERLRDRAIEKAKASGNEAAVGALKNKFLYPDNMFAMMIGYDGVIRNTQDGKEYIALNMDKVAWDRY